MINTSLSLNENQISLLQSSIESLHNTQDWERLTEMIVLQGIRLAGGGKGMFLVFDQSLKQLIPQASVKIEKTESKKIIKICRELLDHDEYREQKNVTHNQIHFFPYKHQKIFSGVLVLLSEQEQLSYEQIKLITMFMQSVSMVVENSRLYLRMQRKTASLTLMNQLHQLVNQFSFQEFLREIVQNLGEVLSSEMCGIMLYEPDQNELVLQKPAFGVWEENIINQYRVSLKDQSNAKDVFLSGIPSITSEASSERHYNQNLIKLFGVETLITVPLVVDDRRIGILHAINKKNGYFTEDDMSLLMEISTQLGVLLEGALQLKSTGSSEFRRLEIEKYLISQLLEYLIDSDKQNLEEAKKISKTLGISLTPHICVMNVGMYTNKKWLGVIGEEQQKFMVNKIKNILPECVINFNGDRIVIISSHKAEIEIHHLSSTLQKELEKVVNRKVANKDNQTIEVYIGIGQSVDALELIGNSYIQAQQILKILPRIQDVKKIAYYPECGSWTLLSKLSTHDDIISPFLKLYLSKINERKDSSELKETLDVYLRNNGLLKKTADELFIHQNTLKYRLEKLQNLTGFDLLDSEARLNLMLALRLEHLC
ncbi:helix-turn-helix domain-containing protein [Bacillus sp. EB600]|uniref:helix-turn-helix domain-containing protein n=1 Tax=Bacillus sp. EB600 TaxID=2806345 RepID=UPI00210E169A|nr:helix-turn-helix domain-containing protein [Bacillus sp. EB600]MCQ6282400.1 helix-turn-helix domain-containing protein [Bacillus sp. EB600]